MKIDKRYCPTCGKEAVCIAEQVFALAIIKFDNDGNADYVGETKILWDTQESIVDEKTGLHRVRCSVNGGHEWTTKIMGE